MRPCWPQECGTSCNHIEINILRFGASQTTYWWIQSILFNYNFLKKLSNLSKTFHHLVGFDGKRTAAGSSKTAAFFCGVWGSVHVYLCVY